MLLVLLRLSPGCPAPVALTGARPSCDARLPGRVTRCRACEVTLASALLPASCSGPSRPDTSAVGSASSPSPHRLLPRAPAGPRHWAQVTVCVTCGLQTLGGRVCRAASAGRKACLTSAGPGSTLRTSLSSVLGAPLHRVRRVGASGFRALVTTGPRCCCSCGLLSDVPTSGFLPGWGRRWAHHGHSCAPVSHAPSPSHAPLGASVRFCLHRTLPQALGSGPAALCMPGAECCPGPSAAHRAPCCWPCP